MKIRPVQPAPKAEKRPHIQTRFETEWTDDYAWMRDDNWQAVMRDPTVLNADIRTHLERENSYTEEALTPVTELKAAIFEEMKGRLEPTAREVPLPDGPYAYFHFYREGDQHGVYARHDVAVSKPEDEIILDCDAEAKGTKFFDLGDVSHSPDHKWLAYSVDDKGSENYQVFLRNLTSGDVSSTGIDRSAGALVWAADNRTLFWVERDENQRPYAVRFRDVFDAEGKIHTAYEEQDPGFFVSVGSSDDDKYIEISAHNHTTGEIHRIPSARPQTPPVCFSARQSGIEYSLHDQGGVTYILTNAGDAVDFQVMTGVSGQTPADWAAHIPHQSGRLILGMEAFENWLVRLEREDALPRLVIRNMEDGEEHAIDMPEAAYGLGIKSGYEYTTDTLYFSYASPSRPGTVYRYNMKTRERVSVREQVVPSGHNPDDYRVERLSITARDGESIPVTILARKDVKIDGSNPLLLYGYGSYGITIPASFRTNILSLVDRGMVYAIAHIRGGMSKGYQWYLDGKLEKKTNTFNDFVDTGRALAELGWTSEGRIVAHGGSAGGLLVGAALNQAPELFAGVMAAVPFVDVLNTMSDTELPLTPPEWPEWGNPITDEDAFHRLRSYSPYDNVTARAYPPTLITGGLTDPRVTYWEPAKWAAKLREHQTGDAPILLKINMDAGHQGESGRYDSLKETALEYAFALDCVGLG
ncbi:MAG: S9 family peptidase [Litorimonas sp.]